MLAKIPSLESLPRAKRREASFASRSFNEGLGWVIKAKGIGQRDPLLGGVGVG